MDTPATSPRGHLQRDRRVPARYEPFVSSSSTNAASSSLQLPSASNREASLEHEAIDEASQSDSDPSDEEIASDGDKADLVARAGKKRKGRAPAAAPRRKAGKVVKAAPPDIVELDLEQTSEQESTPVPKARARFSLVYDYFVSDMQRSTSSLDRLRPERQQRIWPHI